VERSFSLGRAAALLVAAVAGGGVALAGAALLGGFEGETSTVREVEPGPASSTPALFKADGKALSINEIYRRSAPGVVQVTSMRASQDPFGNNPFGGGSAQALGSGFVVDKAGHIVTNYHVVEGAESVEVSFSNNESMKAELVGTDASTDLAVLKVHARSRALTPLPLGESDDVRVGDAVVAIGNPFGLNRTVTAGIVSALQRQITAPNSYSIDHVIQTDAPINQGNSGGPLLNALGQVIGVNAQISTGDSGAQGNVGIAFAIPVDTVKNVVSQLVRSGRVEHPFIGITARPIQPSLVRLYRLPVGAGLIVESVQPGSGAAKAGLKAGSTQVTVAGESYVLGGDLIVAADGSPVATLSRLRSLVSSKKPGDTITLTIYRGAKKVTVDVVLGRQPAAAPG